MTYTLEHSPVNPSDKPQRVRWGTFIDNVLQWKQGEHVGLIGPTGSGKTTIALRLLPLRHYVTVIATKPADQTLDAFGKAHKYKLIRSWNNRLSLKKYPRRILWPYATSMDSDEHQRAIIHEAMSDIYQAGGWCVYIDELWFLDTILNLRKPVKIYLQQTRALLISLLLASQRPSWIPLEVYDQSTHLFFWRDNDERNLNRISGISWLSANVVRETVANLAMHEVLYIDTRSGKMYRTMCPEVK